MSPVEILMTLLMFVVSIVVASLRNRLMTLEDDDNKSSQALISLERNIYNDMDDIKHRVNQSITDLSVRLSGDYVQRRELEVFRHEVITTINEGRKEMLEAIIRLEAKLDK